VLGRRLLQTLALIVALSLLWTLWAELHPSEERALRSLVHDQLDDWFPELMAPVGDGFGLRPLAAGDWPTAEAAPKPPPKSAPESVAVVRPRVLLIHGLDEPGIIWDDLAPAAAAAGFEVWELRYPNDQGIDRSADLLAEQWGALPDDRPVILIGHSMGGLVARDFITRWRHPVGASPRIEGAPVAGLIMVGTPNQGSPWARLRIWLELREHFEDAQRRRFSLFAGLRDGLGQAKIDLRPGSAFLEALNARPWPASVPRAIIGAQLLESPSSWPSPAPQRPAQPLDQGREALPRQMTEQTTDQKTDPRVGQSADRSADPSADEPADPLPESISAGLDALAAEVGSEPLRAKLDAWLRALGDGLGDGAVSVDSLRLEGAPEPLIVNGAHRTMLRRLFAGDPTPPAIAPIIAQLEAWSASQSP
jgi:pimeloyl-ACP methyl ester carboxylesterase